MTKKRFTMYYHLYRSDLSRFACWLTQNPELAEDILQEALCTALKRLDTLPSGVSFRSWMYVNIRFAWSRHNRTSRREYIYTCRYMRTTSPLKIEDGPASDRNLRPWKDEIRQAIENLPEIYRRPILLHEVYGLDCAAVSEAENTYTGTVKSRLYRGRRILRQRLLMVAREENFISWERRT